MRGFTAFLKPLQLDADPHDLELLLTWKRSYGELVNILLTDAIAQQPDFCGRWDKPANLDPETLGPLRRDRLVPLLRRCKV